MNYVDILILIPIIWFIYQGFKKGFIYELASLVALILGIYAALYFSGFAENFLVNTFNMGPKYLRIVSILITFVVVVFFVYAVGKILERIINIVALGFLNKLAGAVFGMVKGAVLVSVGIMLINYFAGNFISDEKRNNSMFYNPIEEIAPMLWERFIDWNLDDPKIKDLQEDMEEMTVYN